MAITHDNYTARMALQAGPGNGRDQDYFAAAAYAATEWLTHRAEVDVTDDEAPADDAWMRSIGWERVGKFDCFDRHDVFFGLDRLNGRLSLVTRSGDVVATIPNTRIAVRTLCRLFGIPMTP